MSSAKVSAMDVIISGGRRGWHAKGQEWSSRAKRWMDIHIYTLPSFMNLCWILFAKFNPTAIDRSTAQRWTPRLCWSHQMKDVDRLIQHLSKTWYHPQLQFQSLISQIWSMNCCSIPVFSQCYTRDILQQTKQQEQQQLWQDSHSLTYIRTVAVCPFVSLLITSFLLEEDSLQRIYGTDIVSLHATSSHSWTISYDLKWYKTSVVFTTVFHRALLSCRWKWSWIVSSVWIPAPWLCLRCQLQDIQSSLIGIPA
jgi:hypothetical protein